MSPSKFSCRFGATSLREISSAFFFPTRVKRPPNNRKSEFDQTSPLFLYEQVITTLPGKWCVTLQQNRKGKPKLQASEGQTVADGKVVNNIPGFQYMKTFFFASPPNFCIIIFPSGIPRNTTLMECPLS